MGLLKYLGVVYFAAVIVGVIFAQTEPDEVCLGCICEGSTGCNASMPCSVPYAGGYFCGPFLISYAFWDEAGKPVLAGDNPEVKGAFENCVLDLQCAANTVRNYMTKFQQDCNNDGKVDCEDFIRIHGLGGYNCRDRNFLNTEFYRRFTKCFDVIKAATPEENNL